MMELVEVELARVVIHQKGDQQFIHLRERHGTRSFPIVIGYNEVEEINRKLCGVEPPRPPELFSHRVEVRAPKPQNYKGNFLLVMESTFPCVTQAPGARKIASH